jgi:cation:H+ antiporter
MTLATGVWYAAVALGSTAVIWTGSGFLDHASERLAGYYGLPPIVRGAIVGVVGLLPVG